MFHFGSKIKLKTPESQLYYKSKRKFWLKFAAIAAGVVVVSFVILGTMVIGFGAKPNISDSPTPIDTNTAATEGTGDPGSTGTDPSITGTPTIPVTTYTKGPNVTANGRMVYLTFDDGPSTNTNAILDTLKSKGVKATFFCIGNRIQKHPTSFKRIYEEGHTLGCHTFSHMINKKDNDYSIYTSPTNIADEIAQWQNAAEKELGTTLPYKIFRFPGGSSYSAVRSNYGAFMDTVHHLGYKAYDWNVVTDDSTVSKPTADFIKQHFTASFSAYEKGYSKFPCIILLHDAENKQATSETLAWIIDYITERGYQFGTLDQIQGEYLH